MYKEYGHWSGGTQGRQLKMHHNQGLEIVSYLAGHQEWIVDGQPETVNAGSLFFTLPWQLHGGTNPLPVGAQLTWLVIPVVGSESDWTFAPELGLHWDSKELERIRHAFSNTQHSHPASSSFHHHLQEAVSALADNDPLYVRALVQLVIIEAVRSIEAKASTDVTDNASVQRVLLWMESVRRSPLQHQESIDAEAAHCGLGRTQFAKLVEQKSGDTPNRFRMRQRILHAANRLQTSSASILAIALEYNFESSQHFARVFKKYMRVTPSAYRRKTKS